MDQSASFVLPPWLAVASEGGHLEPGTHLAPPEQVSGDDGYRYDVFLSFPRVGTAHDWVRNHFHDVLHQTLADELGIEPRIFLYTGQPNGSNWRQNLVGAVRRSKLMIGVWAPPYFRSPWCVAEWKSMVRREHLLRDASIERRLFFPVVFWDGQNFPDEAREPFLAEAENLSRWAFPMPSFRDGPLFLSFYEAMRGISCRIGQLLDEVPAWQPNWPVLTPADFSTAPPPSVKPRL